MKKEQRLLQEYFDGKAVVIDKDVNEYRINGVIYQVVPCERIDKDHELSWLSNDLETIKYKDFYFVKQ